MRYLSALLFLVLFHFSGKGQCVFNLNDTIVADADFYIQGSVSGLVNDDLSANQALCGVKLQFRHQFIGNLQIELVSPAGQKILLVGPPLAGNLTNGTLWDITFVRCIDIPSPDPAIPPQYDNGSPWAIGATYSGSYFPYAGCLEDFNVGSANGIWQLHIINGSFYEGNLVSFSLIFCDPTGVDCNPCKANPGKFTLNERSFCQNDVNLLSFQPPIDYTPDGQNTTLYNYEYVVTFNGIIQRIEYVNDWSVLSPGTYLIYNIAYLKEYESVVKSYIGDPYSVLLNKINSTQICADVTGSAMQLNIFRVFDNPVRNILLCSGDSLVVSGKTYLADTFIRDTLKSLYGCDSIINIDLRFTNIHINIEADTIDCINFLASIDTSGFRMDVPGGLVLGYEWRDNGGNFISNAGGITVNTPGLYFLYMNILYGNLQCEYLIPKKVESQVFPPERPTILPFSPCSEYTLKVLLSADTLRDEAHWSITGTSDFRRIGDTLFVTWHQTGTFKVCVWATNECGTSDTLCQDVTVGQKPVFDILTDSISCNGLFHIEVKSQFQNLTWVDIQGNSIFSVNGDGSLVAGSILVGKNSAVLKYSGSIAGCDLFGSLKFYRQEPPKFIVKDTAFCGSGTYRIPVEIENHAGELYYSFEGQGFHMPVDIGLNYIDLDFNASGGVYIDSLKTQYRTCNDLQSDTLDVRIENMPESLLPDTITLCNTYNRDGKPVYFLPDLIVSGERSGNWNLSSLPGITISNDSIDMSHVAVGTYKVNFRTNTAVLPCKDVTYATVFKVVDCSCNRPALNKLKDTYRICSNYGSLNLDSLAGVNVPVQWFDLTSGSKEAIGGSNLLINDQFVGVHSILLQTVADWEGACADTILFELQVVPRFYAGDDYLMDICNGEDYLIDLDTLLINSLNDGAWKAQKPDYPGFSIAFDPQTNTISTKKLFPGDYMLDKIVAGSDVCPSDTASLTIKVYPLPEILVSGTNYLDCESQVGEIKVDPGASSSIRTDWIFQNDIIHTSISLDSAIIDKAGTYYFSSQDQITGCRDTVSFLVGDNSVPIDTVTYRLIGGCQENGSALILDYPIGGTPPYSYSLDNSSFTSYTQFYDLNAGLHQLRVLDSKGCRFLLDFQVDDFVSGSLHLGRDTTIQLGDEIWVQVDFPQELIEWIGVSLNGTPTVIKPEGEWLKPIETTTIQVLIRDKNGCLHEASRVIFVENDTKLFMPNIFSPNADGRNDVFFVPANRKVEMIMELHIYDRWGNQVFSLSNFVPGEEANGWDGTFHGRKMNPGVFVYYVRYRTIDGKEALAKGDFTLLR